MEYLGRKCPGKKIKTFTVFSFTIYYFCDDRV